MQKFAKTIGAQVFFRRKRVNCNCHRLISTPSVRDPTSSKSTVWKRSSYLLNCARAQSTLASNKPDDSFASSEASGKPTAISLVDFLSQNASTSDPLAGQSDTFNAALAVGQFELRFLFPSVFKNRIDEAFVAKIRLQFGADLELFDYGTSECVLRVTCAQEDIQDCMDEVLPKLRSQSEHNTLRGSPKERRVKISFYQGKHSTKPWKGSKSYGYRYDMLLENSKETEMVICNFEGCRTIFARTGCRGLRHHLKTHEVAVAISQAAVDEALLKFAVCSGQPMSIVGNTHFISFLQAFGNFWVESKEAGHLKQAKDVLPSANTLSSRLDTALESVKEGIVKKLATLKTNGGSLTLDFAKNQVDYIAVTAHFIDDDWKKDDFVLLFEPLPLGMTKTSNNVRFLVEEKLSELGMSAEDQRKLYITTDEGSNVDKLGGHNHVPCICHIGPTIAKHTTVPYKKNCVLSNELKTVVLEKASQISPEDACHQPPSKRASFFQSNKPTVVEQEFKAYSVMWDEDPLIFWKSNAKYMPRLSRLAKWVLSVQAFSSASERAFKELRCVLGDFARNRLNPNRTASLVQLRNSFMRRI
uniref:HAT C-terminal dimerisation domain-containing protein n=1 Tax=Ditylenchus dipsaci TaxID=166011 RepID=A0A915ED64_9BILA